jgi:hypothetical protein
MINQPLNAFVMEDVVLTAFQLDDVIFTLEVVETDGARLVLITADEVCEGELLYLIQDLSTM